MAGGVAVARRPVTLVWQLTGVMIVALLLAAPAAVFLRVVERHLGLHVVQPLPWRQWSLSFVFVFPLAPLP